MNPLGLRMAMTAGIMLATVVGILAYAYMKFPENAVVIALAVAATAGIVFFVQRQEKAARFNVYYATVQQFGTPVNFGKTESAFERDGTRFDIEYPQGEHQQFYKLNFFLSGIRQKFVIQNRTIASRYPEDCPFLENSPLPEDYAVQSRDAAFMLEFLKNREVLNEILNYKASFWGRIMISFEDGGFEMNWTPPISEQIDGFRQLCQTAVVFHDALKKYQGGMR